MTVNDLKNEVAALGFETELENEQAFLFALKRALNTIYTERAVLNTVRIYKPIIKPALYEKKINCGNENIEIRLSAKAYSFITSGIGKYRVVDEAKDVTVDFSGQRKEHRGFLIGNSSIIFESGYAYTVYDFSAFNEIKSQNTNDIPISTGYEEYSALEVLPNFLSFYEPPKDKQGICIQDAALKNGRIFIPTEYENEVYVTYKTAPKTDDLSSDSTIDISAECESALSLLVAAYVWLDDDAEKSQYYMSLYRDIMAGIKVYNRARADITYHDVLGWA